ncbi:hypothetical protein PspLS_08465 [Pyricularia sp. CBS 133598]|nr:hypothetical protein PspLS_08465 [Pyricularia sp. CBS 133598]
MMVTWKRGNVELVAKPAAFGPAETLGTAAPGQLYIHPLAATVATHGPEQRVAYRFRIRDRCGRCITAGLGIWALRRALGRVQRRGLPGSNHGMIHYRGQGRRPLERDSTPLLAVWKLLGPENIIEAGHGETRCDVGELPGEGYHLD